MVYQLHTMDYIIFLIFLNHRGPFKIKNSNTIYKQVFL